MNYQIRRHLLFSTVSGCLVAHISCSLLFAAETNHLHLVSTFVLSNDGETPQEKNNSGVGTSRSPENEKQETTKTRKQKRKKENTKSNESPVQLVPGLPPGIPVPLGQFPGFAGDSPRTQNNPLVPQREIFPPIRPIPQVDKTDWGPDTLRAIQEYSVLLGNIDKSLKSIDKSLKSIESMMLEVREEEQSPGTPRTRWKAPPPPPPRVTPTPSGLSLEGISPGDLREALQRTLKQMEQSKPTEVEGARSDQAREPTDGNTRGIALPSGDGTPWRRPYRGAPPPVVPIQPNPKQRLENSSDIH